VVRPRLLVITNKGYKGSGGCHRVQKDQKDGPTQRTYRPLRLDDSAKKRGVLSKQYKQECKADHAQRECGGAMVISIGGSKE